MNKGNIWDNKNIFLDIKIKVLDNDIHTSVYD